MDEGRDSMRTLLYEGWLLFMAAILCVMTACALRVSQSDLVGTWQMTDDAIRLINPATTNGQPPKMELRADGTLSANNLTATQFADKQEWHRLYSGTGKWSIPPVKRTQGFSAITLRFDANDQGLQGVTMQIDKDSGVLYLFVWLNEEGGERLRFKKSGAVPPPGPNGPRNGS
jgi:hypothetical protein